MTKRNTVILSIILATVFSLGIFMASAVIPQLVSAQESNLIGLQKAQEIALNAAGGGVVTESKLDNKFGMLRYEIEIRNGNMEHEIDINATTGAIIKHEQKMKGPHYTANASITAEQAKTTALGRTGGGEVVKCKLDYEKRGVEYDITIVKGDNKYEIDVDANTGAVIKYEQRMITRSKIAATANMITHDRAKEIALSQVGGSGTILKSKLDYEKKYGTAVYEVEVVKNGIKYEYDINAVNGTIIEYEVDYNYNVSKR